jgi:AcrR family transcriptional regulator
LGLACNATPALCSEARPASRRDQILDAAMERFASAGFRGTTTREIASRVGLTEAALYRHFASKEALYSAIIARKIDAPDVTARLQARAGRMVLSNAEKTDDAFVEGAMSMLAPQVPGRVIEVALPACSRPGPWRRWPGRATQERESPALRHVVRERSWFLLGLALPHSKRCAVAARGQEPVQLGRQQRSRDAIFPS